MMLHLPLIGLVVASTLLGICLASLAWSIRLRAVSLRQYECGHEVGRLGERIAGNARTLQRLDTEYQRGWDARERLYRRSAPAQDVARRVLALQVSRN